MSRSSSFNLLVFAAVFAISASAQTSTGSISGRVVDSSGQVIAEAQVKLTNERSGDVREAARSEEHTSELQSQ